MMRLDGFGIFVKDMPSMVNFYKDALGFEIKEDTNTSNVRLEKDGTLFILRRRSNFERTSHNDAISFTRGVDRQNTIVLSVPNHLSVDKSYADVIRNGAIPIMPPTNTQNGRRVCYISDPEGNLIEISSQNYI